MSNVYVSNIAVPRKARNKRIYGGNSFFSENQTTIGGSGSGQKHFEHGKITNVQAYENTIYYTEPFLTVPVGIGNISVYRLVDGTTMGLPSGSYIKQDVLWYFPTSTSMTNLDSFTITIDSSESLTGVIIEYLLTE